jgi:hypothetical protein
MKNLTIILTTIVFLLAGSVFAGTTVYVSNDRAKLLEQPSFASKSSPLSKGTAVYVKEKKGPFLKVEVNGKTGYVASMFTSETKITGKLNKASGKEEKINKVASTRRRASAYTETASARGLTNSQKMRTMGGAVDMGPVKWLEEQGAKIITKEALEKFSLQ